MKKISSFLCCIVGSSLLNGQVCFDPAINFIANVNLQIPPITKDFNNDGKDDLAYVAPSGNVVYVAISSGNGNFISPVSYVVGSSPTAINSADFNNDGNFDLVVANYNSGTYTILLGNGFGGFSSSISYSSSSYFLNMFKILIEDYNNDNIADLLFVKKENFGVERLIVNLGNGDGTFSELTSVYTGYFTGIISSDINNDGFIDLISGNVGNDQSLKVYFGNGTGSFAPPSVIDSNIGFSLTEIKFADFNNDGNLDMIYQNRSTGIIFVRLGNGNGTFLNPTNYFTGQLLNSILTVDINNDGNIDIVTSNTQPNSGVKVLLGTGLGSFVLSTQFLTNLNLADGVLNHGDFNGDGYIDVIACLYSTSNADILLNRNYLITIMSNQTNASCFGASNGSATINASGGSSFTYAWSPSGGTSATATGLAAGTYNCLVTNNCGNTATQNVVITQPLASSITSGPGGVGDNIDTEMWFDASNLTLANNTAVTTLTDRSGNSRNATQATAAKKPIFLTNQLNGLPVINFDGSNDYLATGAVPDLNTDKQTWFVVTKANNNTHTGQIIGSGYTAGATAGSDHFWKTTMSSATGKYASFIRNTAGTASQIVSNYDTQYHIISNVWDGNSDIHTMFTDGTLNGTVTGRNASPTGHLRVRLGANSGTSLTYWFNGRIAEAFIYSKTLNEAERIIVENYLSTKYNIPLTGLDIFAYQNTHSFDAAGIGMINNTSKTSARGSIVEMSQASSLANGDFLMWAHNNATTISSTSDVPTAYSATSGKRMQRTWRAGKTNDVGTTTVTFYLNGIAAGSLSNLELLVDNDGVFTDATRITSGFSYDDGCKVATWTGVSLTDGQYFTIGSPNGTALLRTAAIEETETELEMINNVTLYPNPNNGEFNLVVNEVSSNMNIEVYNSVGQIVLKEAITSNKTTININKEVAGIYFVKIIAQDGKATLHKIIKQ